MNESLLKHDVAIIGGGLGGVGAALAALKAGKRVVLTEETAWLGGQLTNQATPPDEHDWIESCGATASYRELRARIRSLYLDCYPISDLAREAGHLNPGMGSVSPICCEPRTALAAIEEMLLPWYGTGRLTVLIRTRPVSVEVEGDRVLSVTVVSADHGTLRLSAPHFIDATELGDLLELGSVEHVVGAESRDETGEPSALPGPANPMDQQSITWCFGISYHPGEDHTIPRPDGYDYWRDYRLPFWPDKQLSFTGPHPVTCEPDHRPLFAGERAARTAPDRWHYRRLIWTEHFQTGHFPSDICLVHWPQVDYCGGPLVGVSADEAARHREGARQLSLCYLYWLQTEAPRHDGGTGYRELRPAAEAMGTLDGLAMAPYIRESRRIRSKFTVTELHVGYEARAGQIGAEIFDDSVGIGSYRIDLHPSTAPRNYVDVPNWPFQIPLGAMIPVRVRNLLPGGKNIGTTHITNGCYRLHPVEWNIGEVAGALAAFSLERGLDPPDIYADEQLTRSFQRHLVDDLGIELSWPEEVRTSPRLTLFGDTQ